MWAQRPTYIPSSRRCSTPFSTPKRTGAATTHLTWHSAFRVSFAMDRSTGRPGLHRRPRRFRMLVLILLIAAFILFVLAAFGVGGRFNLVAAGLACWVLAVLLPSIHG